MKFLRQLWRCFRGKHVWVYLHSPESGRTLLVCEFCMRNHWGVD